MSFVDSFFQYPQRHNSKKLPTADSPSYFSGLVGSPVDWLFQLPQPYPYRKRLTPARTPYHFWGVNTPVTPVSQTISNVYEVNAKVVPMELPSISLDTSADLKIPAVSAYESRGASEIFQGALISFEMNQVMESPSDSSMETVTPIITAVDTVYVAESAEVKKAAITQYATAGHAVQSSSTQSVQINYETKRFRFFGVIRAGNPL